jgi:hypothetical protein
MDVQETIKSKFKISRTAVNVIIAALVLFLCAQYYLQVQDLQLMKKELRYEQANKKITSFLNLFIEKVLKAQGEVSFEDRLRLENAARDLDDKELLSLWEKFTQAQTADQIQQAAKDLLQGLVKKIYVNS